MTRTLVIANQKGGVGKTTSAANLASVVAGAGKRVLAIDADPQGNLTRAFGIEPMRLGDQATLFELLMGDAELGEATIEDVREGLDLVPANRVLRNAEVLLASETKREEILRRALKGKTRRYDLVVIDTPPNLGLLTVNALFAATEVVPPVSMADIDAAHGLFELRDTIKRLEQHGEKIKISRLVKVKADRRSITHQEIDGVLDQVGLRAARAEVPRRTSFDHAKLDGDPTVLRDPKSDGAKAYRALARELEVI